MLKLSIALALLLAIPIAVPSQGRNFTIGVEEIDYLPYYGRDGDGYYGYARKVFDLFAQYSGHSFSYEFRPIKRLYLEFLERQELDFKFPDSPDWKASRRKGFAIQYSDPVAEYIDGLMVLPRKKGRIGVEDLQQIGTLSGFTPWSYIDLIKAGRIKVAENSSTIGVLKQALQERVDGAYLNVAVANHQLRSILKLADALVFDPRLPHIKSTYLFSSIKYPNVVAEFTEFLRTRREQITALKQQFRIDTHDTIGK